MSGHEHLHNASEYSVFFLQLDSLLSSTQVAVLNVPENSIFEVVQAVPQPGDHTVGDVNVADIHVNVCANKNNQEELQLLQQSTEHQQQHEEPKVKDNLTQKVVS